MSTIINSPSPAPVERTVVAQSDSSGWFVAVIILIAVIAAGVYFWLHYRQATMPSTANINVTLPAETANKTPTSY